MTETLKGFVPIDPKPQERHRDRRGGGKFDPSKAHKRAFATCCTMAMGTPEKPPTGFVELSLRFILSERPKQQWPDLDNLIKLVMDSLNGIYWKDDKQVWKIEATRVFTGLIDNVGTHIEIS